MHVQTKFNIGDKVWYHIKNSNAYTWGKIEMIEVNVREVGVEVICQIKNRLYIPDYKNPSWLPENEIISRPYLCFREEELGKDEAELRKILEKQHRDRMDSLRKINK